MSLEGTALAIIRRWWRPVTCIGIAATMAVHGVILPIFEFAHGGGTPTDLTGLSFLVTATAGAFAVREWGKIKGAVDDDVA